MVAAHHVVVDSRVLDVLHELLVDDEVVQPPADVLGSSSGSHTPPRVLDGCGIQMPECVDPSQSEELREAVSFLYGEARSPLVSLGSRDVDFLVHNVQVSTPDYWLVFLQRLEVILHVSVVLLGSVVQPHKSLPSVWDVRGDEIELFVLESEDTPLLRVVGLRQILDYRNGLNLRKNSHARIPARYLAKVPIAVIAFDLRWLQVKCLLVYLCLVYAKDIRVARFDILR